MFVKNFVYWLQVLIRAVDRSAPPAALSARAQLLVVPRRFDTGRIWKAGIEPLKRVLAPQAREGVR